MKTDLGYTPQHDFGYAEEAPAGKGEKKKEPRIVYPSVSLEGAAAKAVLENHKNGDTFQVLVTFRVTGMHDTVQKEQEYGGKQPDRTSVELEITEFDDQEEDEEMEEEPEVSAEDAADDFMAEQNAEKE